MSTVLQVISRKDQEQYWDQSGQTYNFFSIDMFSRKFKESPIGTNLNNEISVPFESPEATKMLLLLASILFLNGLSLKPVCQENFFS